MDRAVRLALLSLSLFLLLFPVGLGKPGLPPTLKADEPAYLSMAWSLVRDGDLRFEERDCRRLADAYPYLPIENLILMSDDGFDTVFFGKPFVYSMLAAPAVALLGINGMTVFNMALLLAMIWMGAAYLRRYNGDALAALFAAAFFLGSTAFAYVFWLQPEVLNMFSVAACLFFALRATEDREAGGEARSWLRRLGGRWAAPAWSGAALSLGVYNKPMLAALALPALVALLPRRGWKAAAAWVLAFALGLGALAGLSTLLTGHPSAYLGVARGGIKIEDPDEFGELLEPLREFARDRPRSAHSWTWIFRIPEIDWWELRENAGYFLWGRHTGLLPYMPFAVLALLLFLLHGRASPVRWALAAALAAVALFFLVWIPFNWHGGGGFIGNRYFVNVYPGFLFLVTRIRPRWPTLAVSGAAGLLLGPIFFTPFGAPVPEPGLQAHTRNFPFTLLPLELSILPNVPGYRGTQFAGVTFLARQDLLRAETGQPGIMHLQGGARIEMLMASETPIDGAFFEVRSPPPFNDLTLEVPGDRAHFSFRGERPIKRRPIVELRPSGPSRVRRTGGRLLYVYRLDVTLGTGWLPRGEDGLIVYPRFYKGAVMTYLGARHQLGQPEHYRAAWLEVGAPDEATAESVFEVPVRLRNTSASPWDPEAKLPVKLSYHWLDEAGETVHFDGLRTELEREVAPGEEVAVALRVRAPEEPGRYRLATDLVREHVAWFSERGGDTGEAEVVVTAHPPAADNP